MKILILTDRYPPYYEGGYEINCYHMTEGLKKRNHDLVVLTTTYGVKNKSVDNHVYRRLSNKNIQPLGEWQRRIRDVKQMLTFYFDYNITRRLVVDFSPDLVFIWQMSGASLAPIFAVQDLGIRTVFRIGSRWLVSLKEDNILDVNYFKRFYRLALIGFRRFDEINFKSAIMVSNSIKQKYRSSGFTANDAIVIPSGIPAEWILKKSRNEINFDGPVKLLIAGRLEHEKGTDVAVQALKYLVGTLGCENVSLDFIGKGEELFVDTLKNDIVKNNLQKYINFLGFLPREELLRHFKDYDIVLFPSVIREGLPMTIIESMSQGVPVIASDIGGPNDIIENGRNGLLVPPNDPIVLANALYSLIRSPARRNHMSAEAIQTVLSMFTFERMLDQYEAYLESCL